MPSSRVKGFFFQYRHGKNFSPFSCVLYIDLSSFSFPLLDFLIVNYFIFSSAHLDYMSISQAICDSQAEDVLFVMCVEFNLMISFESSMDF